MAIDLDRGEQNADWLKDWRTLAREHGIPEDKFSVARLAKAMGVSQDRVRRLPALRGWLREHPVERKP